MKQETQIVITGHDGIRLTLAIKALCDKQEGRITDIASQFYKYLVDELYNQNKPEKIFNEEESFVTYFNDELEESNSEDDYEEEYEFEYHRYK